MQTQVKPVTPEEYLELERKADFRNEYRNGEIIRYPIDSTEIA